MLCRNQLELIKRCLAALLSAAFAERRLEAQSSAHAPDRIVLDWDAADFELHGNQQEKFYHGDYREYCYLPLLVFCEDFPR